MRAALRDSAVGIGLVAGALLLGAMALGIGSTGVDLLEVLHPSEVALGIRLPRILLAALAGGALAAAGLTFQAVLQNSLADPYVTGVSGGAALGGALALSLGIDGAWAVPLWAFVGALASIALVLAVARVGGHSDPLTLLLAGCVFNAVCGAAVTFVKIAVQADKSQEILFWLLGSLGPQPPGTLVAMAVYVGLGLACLALGAGSLNLLAVGEEEAQALGLPVGPVRLGLFVAAALLVGAVVAVVGMIGFVGLIVPHALRLILGADHRRLLPASLVAGAAFLVVADAGSRLSFLALGTEVPVGVLTACTGGPFFLVLLLRQRPCGARRDVRWP